MQLLYGHNGVDYAQLASAGGISREIVNRLKKQNLLFFDVDGKRGNLDEMPAAMTVLATRLNGILEEKCMLAAQSKRMKNYRTPCYMSHVHIVPLTEEQYRNQGFKMLLGTRFVDDEDVQKYQSGELSLDEFDKTGEAADDREVDILPPKVRMAILGMIMGADTSPLDRVLVIVDAQDASYEDRVKEIIGDLYTHMPYGWRQRTGFSTYGNGVSFPGGVKLQFADREYRAAGKYSVFDLNREEDYIEKKLASVPEEYRKYLESFLSMEEEERKQLFESYLDEYEQNDPISSYCQWEEQKVRWRQWAEMHTEGEELSDQEADALLGEWSDFIGSNHSGNKKEAAFQKIVKDTLDTGEKQLYIWCCRKMIAKLKEVCLFYLSEETTSNYKEQIEQALEQICQIDTVLHCVAYPYHSEMLHYLAQEVLNEKKEQQEQALSEIEQLEREKEWLEQIEKCLVLCMENMDAQKEFVDLYHYWKQDFYQKKRLEMEHNIQKENKKLKEEQKRQEEEKRKLQEEKEREARRQREAQERENRIIRDLFEDPIIVFEQEKMMVAHYQDFVYEESRNTFKEYMKAAIQMVAEDQTAWSSNSIEDYVQYYYENDCLTEKDYQQLLQELSVREEKRQKGVIDNLFQNYEQEIENKTFAVSYFAEIEEELKKMAYTDYALKKEEQLVDRYLESHVFTLKQPQREKLRKILKRNQTLLDFVGEKKVKQWFQQLEHQNYKSYNNWNNIETVAKFAAAVANKTEKGESIQIHIGSEQISLPLEKAKTLAQFFVNPDSMLDGKIDGSTAEVLHGFVCDWEWRERILKNEDLYLAEPHWKVLFEISQRDREAFEGILIQYLQNSDVILLDKFLIPAFQHYGRDFEILEDIEIYEEEKREQCVRLLEKTARKKKRKRSGKGIQKMLLGITILAGVPLLYLIVMCMLQFGTTISMDIPSLFGIIGSIFWLCVTFLLCMVMEKIEERWFRFHAIGAVFCLIIGIVFYMFALE